MNYPLSIQCRMRQGLMVWPALILLLTFGAALAEEDDHDHALEMAEPEAEEHEDVVELTAAEQAEFGIVVSTAGPGVIVNEVTLPGEIHPNDDRLAHLVPRYEGIVTEVLVHEGDEVSKGQVLAMIESNEALTPYPLKTLIDGTIIAKHITLGESASPDRAPFVVADLSTVWLNLSVYQRDLDLIQPGQQVRVPISGQDSFAEGRISYVTPIVEETTRTATARVVLDNAAGKWRPGMFVVGSVEVSRHEAAVAIPRAALFMLHDQEIVFIQDEHGFEVRAVHTGARDGQYAEILEGLHAGDRFVSAGGFTLKAELEKASFGHGHAH